MKQYGNGILFISNDSLDIDTGLSEREATHAKVFQNIKENGIIITKKADGSFIFEDYLFMENYSKIADGRKNESVFVKGPSFSGVPLYDLFSSDKTKAINAVNILSLAVEYAKQNNISLLNIGPLGTIIGEGNNENQILILPQEIFEKSLNARSDSVFSRYSGIYRKNSLSEIDSWRFTLATYAYRICTDKDAFPNLDSLNRALDYLDFNFVPPECLCILKDEAGNQIDTKNLFSSITNNLRIISTDAIKKSKRNKYAKYSTVPVSIDFTNFKIEYLNYNENSSYIGLEKKIKSIRFFRNNNHIFKIAGIICAFLLFLGVSTLVDKKEKPSTLGLGPEEVVYMMYSGFDTLNIEIFGATIEKRSVGRDLENFISNMYVMGRVRETYESEKRTYTLPQWVNLTNPVGSYFFSVTDVKLTLIEDGENSKKYRADYNVIFNDPMFDIFGYVEHDDLELVFKKDRWLVSSITTYQEDMKIDASAFYEDVQEVINSIPEKEKQFQGVILTEILRPKYSWLPTPEMAELGYRELLEKYALLINSNAK